MNTKKYHILGFAFVLIVGTLMHYAYRFSGENHLVAFIAPVNESPWEHLKLLFFPCLFFAVYEYFSYGKSHSDFIAVKMTSVTSGMMFILIFFYTYSGVLGFNVLALDILDFILADALTFYISFYMLSCFEGGSFSDSVKAGGVILLLIICFAIWTNNPPDLGVFWG